MGYVLSKVLGFWSPVDYDVPDNATGMTPREKEIVQRTWKLVRADAKKNGVKLFMKEIYQAFLSGCGLNEITLAPESSPPLDISFNLIGSHQRTMHAFGNFHANANHLCLLEMRPNEVETAVQQ